jgi:hypothetical protein
MHREISGKPGSTYTFYISRCLVCFPEVNNNNGRSLSKKKNIYIYIYIYKTLYIPERDLEEGGIIFVSKQSKGNPLLKYVQSSFR